MKKVSNWWYFLPVFLSIPGGVVAWAVNKKHDPEKAKTFLWVGGVIFVLTVVVMVGLSYIVVTSLDEARERSEIVGIKSAMHQVRSLAEIERAIEGSYEDIGCFNDSMTEICDWIEKSADEMPSFNTSEEDYCVYIRIGEGSYYCIGSSFSPRETDIFPGEKEYCSESTYICPPSISVEN